MTKKLDRRCADCQITWSAGGLNCPKCSVLGQIVESEPETTRAPDLFQTEVPLDESAYVRHAPRPELLCAFYWAGVQAADNRQHGAACIVELTGVLTRLLAALDEGEL